MRPARQPIGTTPGVTDNSRLTYSRALRRQPQQVRFEFEFWRRVAVEGQNNRRV
jgi:hypothetical protein